MKMTDTATVTSDVDPEWVEYCTQYADLLERDHCGYWLRGVERDDALGWLTWEDDEQHSPGEEPEREAAIAAWRAGAELPKGWYRLDRDAAVKAWGAGVKKWGVDWYEDADAHSYDCVIQMALLGEHRYG